MSKRIIFPILVAFFVSIYALSLMNWHPAFSMDDAYIVQHAVSNIINSTDEKVFVDASKNAGLTSLFHVSLIAAFSLFLDISWSQYLVACLSLMAFLIVVFKYTDEVNKNTWINIVITLIAALSGMIINQTFNGLETILVVYVVFLALYLFREGLPKNKISFVLLVVFPFIRPELMFLSIILIVRSMWYLRKSGSSKDLITITLILTLSAATLALYSIVMVGDLLPNTAGAKKYFFAEACQNYRYKLNVIFSGLLDYAKSLGLLSLGLVFILFSKFRYVFIAFALMFYALYFRELPGGIYHNNFRYQYVFYAFALVGLIEFIAFARVKKLNMQLVLVVLMSSIFFLNKNLDNLGGAIYFNAIENFGVSQWVKKNIPKDQVILIHDAGVISTVVQNPLVDLVGLKTRGSVEINKSTRWAQCVATNQAVDLIAQKYKAQYLIVLDGWDQIFHISDSLVQTGWQVQRVDGERGNSSYKVYKISKSN